jgi:hypothetical protein
VKYGHKRKGMTMDLKTVEAFVAGGKARLLKLEVNQLESIWKK